MELFRALAVLAESPTDEAAPIAKALTFESLPDVSQYTDLFTFQLYPYASVYLGEEGMLGGEATDRIAGFWRALGQAPPAEADHLSVMLALYARLAELEATQTDAPSRERWRGVRRAFLWEHLLSWLPAYLSKLIDIAPPFYQKWGEVLLAGLFEEALTVGTQQQISLHLREAPGLVDPREGDVDGFLQSLLTPVRSGMILVRSDFSRAAQRLGLGTRIGERKFIIKSLLSQDAGGVLDWLVDEATEWTKRHRLSVIALGETAVIWENKAATAAALLGELKLST